MEQFLINGFCRGVVYALIASSFSLIYNTTRIFHIAHSAVCIVAAYAAFLCISSGLSLYTALIGAFFAASIAGVSLDFLVYRPLSERAASPLILLISSLGANVILTHLLAGFFGNQPRVLYAGTQETVALGAVTLAHSQVLQVSILLPLGITYALVLARSRVGRLCRAIADDPILVSVLGYDVQRLRFLVFSVGSGLSGLAVTLFVLDVGFDPGSGLSLVLSGVVSAIIGGLRNPIGPLLGGLTLGFIQGMTAWAISSRWETAVAFLLLLVFFFIRPTGLTVPAIRVSHQ